MNCIIGFKIAALPYNENAADLPKLIRPALAFCKMLTDCMSAALHGNLSETDPNPVRVSPNPSGYYGIVYVLDCEAGLATVQNVLGRYFLGRGYEIVFKTILDNDWRHHSGEDFGPFDKNHAETVEWAKSLRDVQRTLPPQSASGVPTLPLSPARP